LVLESICVFVYIVEERGIMIKRTVKGLIREFEDKCRISSDPYQCGETYYAFLPIVIGENDKTVDSTTIPIFKVYYGLTGSCRISTRETPLVSDRNVIGMEIFRLKNIQLIVYICSHCDELKSGYFWDCKVSLYLNNDINYDEWTKWITNVEMEFDGVRNMFFQTYDLYKTIDFNKYFVD